MKILKYICGTFRAVFLMLEVVVVVYSYIIVTKLFVKHKPEYGFRVREIYLKILNPIIGFNVDVKGIPDTKPALYVSNHRGILDFFVILRYVDAYILSKAEVAKIPVFGYASKFTGTFFVDRENKNSRSATRDAIVEILKSGHNVLLFTEGTTNNQKTTAEFKLGAFEEAAKNGFPVVPVALEYKTKEDLWKDTPMGHQFYSQFGKCKTHVKLAFGPKIESSDGKYLMDESRKWIDSNLIAMQENWSEVF